jgi:hypothetical protein
LSGEHGTAKEDAMTEGFSQFTWRTLAPGTPVMVGDGPLQGLRGTILGTYENGRVIVAVTLLRSEPPVELDPTEICVDAGVSEPPLLKH